MQTSKNVWTRGRSAALLSSLTAGTVLIVAVMFGSMTGCNIIFQTPTPTPDPCANNPCNDNNPCTTDTCVASNGTAECTNTAKDCGNMFCDPDDGACVECVTNAHCSDNLFCNGDETCGADNTCQDGTAPCAAGEFCNETADRCDDCQTNADCADDGLFCNGTPVCDNGTCGTTGNPCQTGQTCDEDNDTCVTPSTEFGVSFDNCPTSAVGSGTTTTLTASVENVSDDGLVACQFSTSSGNFMVGTNSVTSTTVLASNGTCSADFVAGGANATVTVNGIDFDDTNTNGAYDSGTDAVNDQASTTCAIMVQFTPQLLCNAGGLVPQRATTGALFVADALEGSASQVGFDAATFFYDWSVMSQPAGSGAVTFSNENDQDTDLRIAPPARAGEYLFSFSVTNTQTGDTCEDTVSLDLLEPPTVRVADEQSPMRLVELRGSAGVEALLWYTSDSAAFIQVFDGTTAVANEPGANDQIASVDVDASTGANATVVIDATGFRETADPQIFDMTSRITDAVDVLPGDGSGNEQGDLENPNPTPDRASLEPFYLITTDNWTATDSTTTPPVIDIGSEVGEVDGGGVIVHQGIGSNNAGLPNGLEPEDSAFIADINEDGFGDLITLTNNWDIEIFFGAPDIVTQLADVGNEGWPAAADITIDGTNDFRDFCVGDVDGDGHLDIVTISATGATFVEVWLLDGEDTTDLGNADASRTYDADDDNNADLDLTVLCGDVGVGAGTAGVDDIVAISSGYDDDNTAAASDDGVIFVIYGRADLPADGDIEADAVTGLTGSNQNGERIFDTGSGAFPAANSADEFGTFAALGQWDGGSGMDLVVAEGADGDASGSVELRVYLGGGSRMQRNPQRVYTSAGATDLDDGYAIFADLTDSGSNELVVGSDNLDTVYIIPNQLANTTLNNAQIFNYDLASFNVPLFGGGNAAGAFEASDVLAAYDINGDGVNDLLIGDSSNDRVIVVPGPITSNVENTSDLLIVYEDDANGDDYGELILFGDVTGDGLVDFLLGTEDDNGIVILQGAYNGQ